MVVGPLSSHKSHGLHAVGSNMQLDGSIGSVEDFLGQPDITGTVFDQENIPELTVLLHDFHDFLPLPFKAKRKVEPCPGFDSTEMLPPCRSTIFLQMANPMPVPANLSLLCSRWNMPKIFSKYCESIPSPLSCTENTHFFLPFLAAEMCTRGTPGLWYLMALPTRF